MTVPRRVSIGIPTINRGDLALRAIRSALAQTYSDVEVIVSDDASTDDTVARIREIRDPRLVIFEQKQRLGLVGNFDFCLRHATGEFFLLLGDDDVLLPTAIERLVEPFLLGTPPIPGNAVGMVWCPCIIADAGGRKLWVTDSGPTRESPASMISQLLAGNRGSRLSSILIRTTDSISVGGYVQRHGDHCDLGNWGRAALLHDYAICISEPLVQYTQHYGSTTSQSSVKQWQDWASLMHADLLDSARSSRDPEAARKIKSSKRNLISGVTLCILIQTIGKPGWIRNALRESFHSPSAFFTPYMFHRLLKDGRKVFAVRRHAEPQPNIPVSQTSAKTHPIEKVS